MFLQFCYWICVCLAVYPYVGYPLVAYALARIGNRSVHRAAYRAPVSIVMAVHNEAKQVERRVRELAKLAVAQHRDSEVIVVSDGSTDGTGDVVRALTEGAVRLIEMPVNGGKAVALNVGVTAARHDVVVFADVRQTFADDALPKLLENFADPSVGAVSGDLELVKTADGLKGVGSYWRFEKWLRKQESRWHSSVGLTGAIAAVRREAFRPLPPGTILDDVYWPMAVVLGGRRAIHDERAKAFDQLPASAAGEFRRKLRTLSGNFQLLSLMPELLAPWRNPLWLQFLSHKVARLAAPWCLIAALVLSGLLLESKLYLALFVTQLVALAAGWLGMKAPVARALWPVSLLGSVFSLNFAAWMAFWMWVLGRSQRTWKKVEYAEGPVA